MPEEGLQSPIGTQIRKEKFSEEDLRVLTAEVTQHEIQLFGKASASINYPTKEATLSSIVEKVDAFGVTRTVNQVMKKGQDLHQRTKAKLATQHRHAAGTGGGPPSTSQLTPLERQAERTTHPKQSDTIHPKQSDTTHPKQSDPTHPKQSDPSQTK
ncbi:UNVERIFIED_CONTAM: hypothetical protein FKN15_046877 [Acipenser sinensis]